MDPDTFATGGLRYKEYEATLIINQTIDTNVAQVRDVPDDTPAKQSGLRKTVGKADEVAT